MKTFLIVVLAMMAGWQACDYFKTPAKPKDYAPVVAVVREGDTVQGIVERAQKQFGDKRDWRIIADQAKKDNDLGRFIYPGQFVILRMEVK